MQRRPSSKELHGKICEALAHLESGSWQALKNPHLVSSLDELGLADENALIDLLEKLLEAIRAAGAENCYAGENLPPNPMIPR